MMKRKSRYNAQAQEEYAFDMFLRHLHMAREQLRAALKEGSSRIYDNAYVVSHDDRVELADLLKSADEYLERFD